MSMMRRACSVRGLSSRLDAHTAGGACCPHRAFKITRSHLTEALIHPTWSSGPNRTNTPKRMQSFALQHQRPLVLHRSANQKRAVIIRRAAEGKAPSCGHRLVLYTKEDCSLCDGLHVGGEKPDTAMHTATTHQTIG